jgi:hypothetical protein
MVVYDIQPCPDGWRVMRDGQPTGRYQSVRRALAVAEHFAQRERERDGSDTVVVLPPPRESVIDA